jgi:hypothetical protein
MAEQTASAVRALAFRSRCLSLAKTCSIGLRSGEYFGRKMRCAPALRMAERNFALVAAEIVHDDDVAGTKRWDENRFDVEEKALAIDGTIDEPGRLDTVMAERRKEGHRIPVTIRRLGFQAFSSWAPATQRRHICFGPGLVDKDEPSWINAILIPCPLGAPPSNVGTILLCGQKCFF